MSGLNLLGSSKLIKNAVAYYRHSAEDKQENSVPIQREHAGKFASDCDIKIIHYESDEGKSGLTAKRPGFQRLIKNWIENPNAPDFDYVIVNDPSRWGRFQDPDEAGHYEHLCRKNGKEVLYITHGFPDKDRKPLLHLQTAMERHMASEYSRQLSTKVFYGCKKVSEQGYSAGGISPYGMARLLLDENKKPLRILKRGEHKAISNQRVTFTPANDQTTETVKQIFTLFVTQSIDPKDIANQLNAKIIPSASGGEWNMYKIRKILKNEAYIGTRIYNKTWGRLKQKKRKNPKNEWVVCENAYEPVIEKELFMKAQELLYWSTPSKWKKGVYTIRRIHRSIQQQLEEFYTEKSIDYDDRFILKQNFPITYSITFYLNKIPHWCFFAPSQLKKNQAILSIGISLDNQEIEKIFLIPSEDFGFGGAKVVSENDQQFSQYCINEEEMEEKLLSMTEELKKAVIY